MTDTPIADDTQPQYDLTLWGKIHADSVHGWEIFSRMFPVMEKIALNPPLNELFTEAMRSHADGVAADRFHAAADILRGARHRQQFSQQDAQRPAPAPSGPQPQFTATPDNGTLQLPVAPGGG